MAWAQWAHWASWACLSAAEILPLEELYLQTLVGTLTGEVLRTRTISFDSDKFVSFDATSEERQWGRTACAECLTMMGSRRLRDLWDLLDGVRTAGLRGDFVQAGTWRGGASIFARGYFHSYKLQKKVYACDSFQGFPGDASDALQMLNDTSIFHVSEAEVARNFAAFGLDEDVHLVPGFFSESMAKLRDVLLEEGRQIAILHLDADLYSSYLDVLFKMYDLVELGGYVVCDDCGSVEEAGRAVTDFRVLHGIEAALESTTHHTRFWRKTRDVSVDIGAFECWRRSRQPWGLISSCMDSSDSMLRSELRTYLLWLQPTFEEDIGMLLWMLNVWEESEAMPLWMVVDFLQETSTQLLKVLGSVDAFHKPEVQEATLAGFMLIQFCTEKAMRLLFEDGQNPADSKAKRLLNSAYEARFRIEQLPEWSVHMV
ncbi:unnamed protein product [Effrenium voratum]|nr:unnamed protein product [Effrenium voratum]